jgi:hypothetical protein
MKYLIRVLTLPFVWIWLIFGISFIYIKYGKRIFRERITDINNINEKNMIEKDITVFIN